MSLLLVTPPTSPLEQLLLPDLKEHLRIDSTLEDAQLSGMLAVAREYLEGQAGVQNCALLTQTWDWNLDAWPSGVLELPLRPLQSVTSLTVRDAAGVATVWAPTNYLVDKGDGVLPGRMIPVGGVSWPIAAAPLNPITIRFVAGYGTTRESIPDTYRQALLGLAAQYYTARDTDVAAPRWIDALLAAYTIEV